MTTRPSDTPLTEAELSEIEAAANAATGAPWEASLDDFGISGEVEACVSSRGLEMLFIAGTEISVGSDDCWNRANRLPVMADARFIARARTDVPRLVAEVRRLQEELARPRAGSKPVFTFQDEERLVDVEISPERLARIEAKLAAAEAENRKRAQAECHLMTAVATLEGGLVAAEAKLAIAVKALREIRDNEDNTGWWLRKDAAEALAKLGVPPAGEEG